MHQVTGVWERRLRWAALAACGASLALGLALLDFRALWGDEAFSWVASQHTVAELFGGLDSQPPLFHILLGAARVTLGDSAFALRFGSVLCGVVFAAFAARAGRFVLGWLGAAVCVWFVALSPLVVYFQQEARMYALAAALSAGAIAATLELAAQLRGAATNNAKASVWAAYAALTLGALFTHFYSVGVLLVNALALLIFALGRSRARAKLGASRRAAATPLMRWALANAAIAALFGAWFFGPQWRYLSGAASGRSRLFAPLNEIAVNVQRGVSGIVFGMRADAAMFPAALLIFVAAVTGAIFLARERRTRPFAWMGLGWLAATFGLVFLTASQSAVVPDFSPRYLIFVVLPLAVLTCGWLTTFASESRPTLARVGAGIVALMLLSASAVGLSALYRTDWQKSQYDQLLATLRARAGSADVAVLVNSDQLPHYAYYGPTGLETWVVNNNELSRSPDVGRQLDDFISRTHAARVWLVNYGWASVLQPRSAIEQRLNATGVRVFAQGFQDATLALYDRTSDASATAISPANARFDDGIALEGVRWRAGILSSGDSAAFDLMWRAGAHPSRDYTVFVHLRRVGDGAQVGAFDSPPAGGARGTSTWQPGEVITDTRGVIVPKGAPPGEYEVVVGMYAFPELTRLKLAGSDATEFVAKRFEVQK